MEGNVQIKDECAIISGTMRIITHDDINENYRKSFTRVIFKGEVEEIGEGAFEGCTSLREIEIPGSVKTIGERAFKGCTSLTRVNFKGDVEEIGEGAFEGCTSLREVKIPESVKTIGKGAFKGCTKILSINIPSKVDKIGAGTFENCLSLGEIEFSKDVKTIEKGAFKDCKGLTSVIFKGDVKKIAADAFDGCSSLTEAEIPKSVEKIKDVFKECTNLIRVIFKSDVEEIAAGAFDGCTSLREVEFSKSVKKIGKEAFKGCASLTSVIFKGDVKKIAAGAFDGCTSLREVEFSKSVEKIKDVFKECTNLIRVIFKSDVEEIAAGAFDGCTSLREVEFSKSVKKIGKEAFKGCASLTSVIFKGDVKKIAGDAFKDCASIWEICCPKSAEENVKKAFNEYKDKIHLEVEESKEPTQNGQSGSSQEAEQPNMQLNRISTGIDGLDELLFGGLHLHSERKKGTIIVVRGPEAIHKLQFSVHLMCGIAKSLYREDSKEYIRPCFYSLSKDEKSLNDIFLDFQISNIIYNAINDDYNGKEKDTSINELFHLTSFFDTFSNPERGFKTPEDFVDELKKGICHYSLRTHGIHFKKYVSGDDCTNLLCRRQSDIIKDYFNGNTSEIRKAGIINVDIKNYVKNDGEASGAMANFHSLLTEIDKESKKKSCIVLHGFSSLSTNDLNRLPLDYLVNTLRNKAVVSILVFDERCADLPLNADMFIDMRRNETNYMFHELRICETSYQAAALGWHKFKLRDYGIEVYPSIHRAVQKRYYMSNVDFITRDGMTDISYSEYISVRRKFLQ